MITKDKALAKFAELTAEIEALRIEAKKLDEAADNEWGVAHTANDETVKYGKELAAAHAEAKALGHEVSYFPKVTTALAIAYINWRHFKDSYAAADLRWHGFVKAAGKVHRTIDAKKRSLAKAKAAIG
jgi:hypothetical protein